jgi:toxin-antitoxin system PIN domain toxin
VILVDANLLLYAHNSLADEHKAAKDWLEEVLSGPEPFALCWPVVLAFLRLATSPRIFARPLSRNEAIMIVSEWIDRPQTVMINAGERHWEIFQNLSSQARVAGPLFSDCHLAALAVEYGAVVYTTDREFARFPNLQFKNPLVNS